MVFLSRRTTAITQFEELRMSENEDGTENLGALIGSCEGAI